MKKVLFVVLIMVFMLAFAATAFADPNPPENPHGDINGGSCNMIHAWWDSPPGEANGVTEGESGMNSVHNGENPHHGQQGKGPEEWYTNGADNMDNVTDAHVCVLP